MLLGVMVIFGPVSATIASLVVNIAAIMLLPVLLSPGTLRMLRAEAFVIIWVVAFAVLGLSFAVTANQVADIRFIINFLPFLLAIPVYVVARSLASRQVAGIVLLLCLGGAAAAVAVGIFDTFVLGLPRPEGYYSGALVIARMGLLFGFLASAGFFVLEGPRRYVYLLGPVLGLIAIILAEARGALLIVPILAVLFLLFLIFDQSQKYRWQIAGSILLAGAGAAGVTLVVIDGGRLVSTFAAVTGVLSNGTALDASIQQRLDFYSAGWTLFVQSPWLGYGWADIPKMAFTILDVEDYNGAYSLSFFDFHNDFLNFAVAAGVVGVGVLLAFFTAPIVGVLTSQRDALFSPRLFAVCTIVIIFVLSGLTDISLGFDRYTAAYAMMSAIILGVMREKSI